MNKLINKNTIVWLEAILTTMAFTFITDLSVANIYSLIIVVILQFIYSAIEKDNSIYVKISALIFGLFASLELFQVTVYPDEMEKLSLMIKMIKIVVTMLGTYCFASYIISFLFFKFDRIEIKKSNNLSANSVFIISLIVLLVLYLPTWLMEYPSNIGADTLDQIKQILTNVYRNHHPFAHTMWLKLLMSLGKEINQRVGIASLLQLILNALVFSYTIKTIYKKTSNLLLASITLAFYGLLSFNAFLAVNLMKDVTHATIALMLCILIINYFDNKKNILLVLIGIFAVGFCLFRTNGYYALIFMTVVLAYRLIKKKETKLLAVFCISILVATLIKGPLYTLLGVSSASFAENLSIPLQQIALVIQKGYSITDYQSEMLNKIMDITQIPSVYDCFLSDPIKNLLNESGNIAYLKENMLEYLKIWIAIGIKHPFVYIQAWVNQVSTFFSPRYYGTSITWTLMDNDIGLVGTSLLINGSLNEKLHLLAYYQHNIPILGLFHYPAISTWILIVMSCYSLKKQKLNSTIITTLMIGIFLTLLISCPYNICFRYYYAVICCVPVFILSSLIKGKENYE